VQISVEAFADRVWLRLSHTGETFDPKAVGPPAFDGSREGGFGVYIVAHSVDEVRHGRDDRGRNCISLMKYRFAA
jgi:anti-sigma regulatory factor (Ser/Thr protein kinase)